MTIRTEGIYISTTTSAGHGQHPHHPHPPMHDDITLLASTLQDDSPPNRNDPLVVLLPLLIVLSTLLFLLLLFLICILIIRRRRAIVLRDHDGPIDLSREDLIDGDGGFEGVENRWLETVSEVERTTYRRAQSTSHTAPPNPLSFEY